MFVYRLKNFICVALAVIFSLFFAVGIKAVGVSRLADIEGERTYFLDSASSQGLRKNALLPSELTRVKGECVHTEISTYEGGRYKTNEEIAKAIAARYHAEIYIIEEVDGVLSYYAYTEKWQDGLYINGKKINLHVAVGNGRLVVGTPIIFDGF